jgi:hypothetical protein
MLETSTTDLNRAMRDAKKQAGSVANEVSEPFAEPPRRTISGVLHCKMNEQFCSDLTYRSRLSFLPNQLNSNGENICQRKLQSITRKHQNI